MATWVIYEQDFHAWTQQQANLLRTGELAKLDSEHLAEELESMGGSERQALSSRLTGLLMHLLKWKYQPERRGSSWISFINKQRIGFEVLLEESPSLEPQVSQRFERAYQRARRYAAVETHLPIIAFPEVCPVHRRAGSRPGILAGIIAGALLESSGDVAEQLV